MQAYRSGEVSSGPKEIHVQAGENMNSITVNFSLIEKHKRMDPAFYIALVKVERQIRKLKRKHGPGILAARLYSLPPRCLRILNDINIHPDYHNQFIAYHPYLCYALVQTDVRYHIEEHRQMIRDNRANLYRLMEIEEDK